MKAFFGYTNDTDLPKLPSGYIYVLNEQDFVTIDDGNGNRFWLNQDEDGGYLWRLIKKQETPNGS